MFLSILTGLLTGILVLDCLFLLLLILIQLPKKEAGLGQAFGGAATDALFGAGTGNVLTKLTKYATAVFFVTVMVLTIMNVSAAKRSRGGNLRQAIEQATKTTAPKDSMVNTNVPATPAARATAPALNLTNIAVTNVARPAVEATNLPRPVGTNALRPAVTTPPTAPAATK